MQDQTKIALLSDTGMVIQARTLYRGRGSRSEDRMRLLAINHKKFMPFDTSTESWSPI